MTNATRNGLIAFLLALVIIGGGLIYRLMTASDETQQSPLAIGGPFTLTDASGAVRRDTDFRGKLMLIYFGYTYCPDVCPTTLTMMSDAMTKLGPDAAKIVPIFVTVDPGRDTPAQMKQYMESFDPHFVALTGTDAGIAQVAQEYRVYYRKVAGDNGAPYTMDHSSVIYLMARDGNYLGHFNANIGASDLARALQKYL